MIKFKISPTKCILMAFLSILTVSCDLFSSEGREIIFGKATINEKEYKDTNTWSWNYQPGAPALWIMTHYKWFSFRTILTPPNNNLPNYFIHFFIQEDSNNLRLGHQYKLECYNSELDIKYFNETVVIPYLDKNKSSFLSKESEGISFIYEPDVNLKPKTDTSIISLSGEFVVEEIYEKTGNCVGRYSLRSSRNSKEQLVIEGKFEATLCKNEQIYKNK